MMTIARWRRGFTVWVKGLSSVGSEDDVREGGSWRGRMMKKRILVHEEDSDMADEKRAACDE